MEGIKEGRIWVTGGLGSKIHGRAAAAGWFGHGCSANLLEGGELLVLWWGPAQGFWHRVSGTDRAGALPWHWVLGGEQRKAEVSQQEGCFPSVREAWWEGGQILPLEGGPGEGGRTAGCHHPRAAVRASRLSRRAGLVARDVRVPTQAVHTRAPRGTGTWVLRYASCAGDIPAVPMNIPAVLPLERALLLEVNGLLLLLAQCTALVAGEVEDCVLRWHFGTFSFWFEVGVVSPAGRGTRLHPPVGPGPCGRAAPWQEPRGEKRVKTTRFQRRKSRKRESSCPLPSQPQPNITIDPLWRS